ncbi:hypothetical protein ACO1PK_15640 [Alishewanella sp. d11]|uniref:hypothetical protein n=1 Tax=Alishewanella sp. d11 TaxID=3414030 RepID=UPI003BF8E730
MTGIWDILGILLVIIAFVILNEMLDLPDWMRLNIKRGGARKELEKQVTKLQSQVEELERKVDELSK